MKEPQPDGMKWKASYRMYPGNTVIVKDETQVNFLMESLERGKLSEFPHIIFRDLFVYQYSLYSSCISLRVKSRPLLLPQARTMRRSLTGYL